MFRCAFFLIIFIVAYEYSDQELKDFIPHVQTSAKMAKETFVMFNNCHGGYAMRNAEKLKVMLRK